MGQPVPFVDEWRYRRIICGRKWCNVDGYPRAEVMAFQRAKIASGDWPGVALLVGMANGYIVRKQER